jgi:ribosomal protein L37AE/L43A
MKSSTLPKNTELKKIAECEDCGKDISNQAKYSNLGENIWKCKECYNK